ncbi:MAG: SIMPL domain-containing protein [Saprospiraceae bacterium]|nr:SIMPL domain-containing protein [Saprospiraceae bacterium]
MKNYVLPAMTALLFLGLGRSQAQEGRFIEVIGQAEQMIEPNEILYNISINTEKFYDEYEFDYDYDQFDPVKYREIQNKVELRANSAKRQLMELLEEYGIEDQEIQSDQYNIVDRDVYTVDSYRIRVSDFEVLQQLVERLRSLEIFQGQVASMNHSDGEKIQENLKLEALKKANAKAQRMAKALDANIGEVLQIRESGNLSTGETTFTNIYYENQNFYNNGQGNSSTTETKIKFQAQVWVRFALR